MKNIKKIGLIVNPIAGMGGKTALKGTDGVEILAQAIALGAVAEAPAKALKAVMLLSVCSHPFELVTCSGKMGADICEKAGLDCNVVYHPGEHTTSEDTFKAASILRDCGVELILFAGGDGTARDIYSAVGQDIAVIGIPAGVKIQSAVFALSPQSAGRLACNVIESKEPNYALREVVDLDEEQYRLHKIRAKLYGYLRVPESRTQLQSMKVGKIDSDQNILKGAADHILTQMRPDCYYAIGPGTTAKSIMQQLNLPHALLGVDIIYQHQVVASDVSEAQLWELAQTHPLNIVVSPIGGQGFLFGRGNHQFSSRILKKVGKDSIIVVSSQEKLVGLVQGNLKVDSGDEETDKMLRGFYQVICGYKYLVVMRCE